MTQTYTIGGYQVSDQVLSAVREASRRTGIDFRYMMAKAATESAFQPTVRAGSTGATGLYQFIDSTWLAMIKTHGHQYGLGRYADQIGSSGGGLSVADPAVRREILNLRNDPRISALMAGEYALENRDYLSQAVGGTIGPTELYLGHFLGAGGAAQFLGALRRNPSQTGAALFPAAAACNGPAFYDGSTGRALTLREIYDQMARRVENGMAMVDDLPAGVGAGDSGMANFAALGGTAMAAAGESPLAALARAGSAGAGDLTALRDRTDALAPRAGGEPMDGQRRLSLWTVVTLSSLPMPGVPSQAHPSVGSGLTGTSVA